ncbi:DgyrCDS4372 [Dimorphilus gyrociliatus]|uniref:DgyrCDS4372 n=1 Tax=Dimorphilus gyrociliatus TaxID=2664684 RepID=A0A7I8VGU7_9ANNE|nr:DgyrCDS4372 [Dimorphilus gyrociliatus]
MVYCSQDGWIYPKKRVEYYAVGKIKNHVEFILYRPGLTNLCGPTHLLRNNFLDKSINYRENNIPKSKDNINEGFDKKTNYLSAYSSISFEECQQLCAEYREKLCTGFLYTPIKDKEIVGYCRLSVGKFCEENIKYFVYLTAGQFLYQAYYPPCKKEYDVDIYKIYKEKGILQGYESKHKWEKDKADYFLDSKYYICYLIKHNVTYKEAKNLCKQMNMNLIRPYLISSMLLSHFPTKTLIWSGMIINKTRMFYEKDDFENILLPNSQSEKYCSDKLTVVCQKPLTGLWSSWGQWSNCPCYRELGSKVKKHRIRYCNDPKPHKIAVDEKRVCGRYNYSIDYENESMICPPLRHTVRELVEINNILDHKEDICRAYYSPTQKYRSDATLIEKNYQGKRIKDCLLWCIRNTDCQELNISIDLKKMNSSKRNSMQYKCVSSDKFCSFVRRDLLTSFLFRRSVLVCHSKYSKTCRTAMYHHELETGLCLIYEPIPKTFKEALRFCSLYGMHLMKFEHFFDEAGLPDYFTSKYKEVEAWLGLIKTGGVYKWNSKFWSENATSISKRITEADGVGNCYIFYFRKNNNVTFKRVRCNKKHFTMCYKPHRGQWGMWSQWRNCHVKLFTKCLFGYYRTRTCDSPPPYDGYCLGRSAIYRPLSNSQMILFIIAGIVLFVAIILCVRVSKTKEKCKGVCTDFGKPKSFTDSSITGNNGSAFSESETIYS